MGNTNKEMIGYEEISNDPDLQEAAAGLLRRFSNGAVSDLLNVFFSNKDGVPRDVFDYFCASDFFPLFVDEAAEIVRKLIDFKAERGWYELIEDVCRNQKSVALYCKEIYHCFTQNYSIGETKSLYEASEKPGDMSTARRKNKQDAKATAINKRKDDRTKNQNTDSGLSACYEKLNQNYAELNGCFQNLSKEYHGFGSYLSLLMEDNKKIRAAHFECQMELDAEKEKNAVLEARIREQEGVVAELKTLLQQFELMIEKSDQIMEMVSQLSATPPAQSLDDAERVDSEEDPITDDDLNFALDFNYEAEFGMPDEETLNQINGNASSSDAETVLYDPEVDGDLSVDEAVEDNLPHGVPDAEGDEQTISPDPSEKVEIKDHYQEVKKKASVFTSLTRKFEKRKFERKNFTEQKNFLFKKMREYSFETDRIGVVRQIIDAGGSLPALYTLVENNPDIDALNGYLAVMKKDMTRAAAGA